MGGRGAQEGDRSGRGSGGGAGDAPVPVPAAAGALRCSACSAVGEARDDDGGHVRDLRPSRAEGLAAVEVREERACVHCIVETGDGEDL